MSDAPDAELTWVDPYHDRTWRATIEWSFMRGRWEPVSVLFRNDDGLPVTASTIRRMPFGEMVTDARRAAGKRHYFNPAPSGPRRGSELTDDELRQVADCFRDSHAAGFPPILAVAEQFGISRSAANKRVALARFRKLL